MTLVDTNVIIDILSSDAIWFDWSAPELEGCRRRGPLLLNEISYAELAARVETEADLQQALADLGIKLSRTPTSALFAAGRAFRRYRSAGGLRTSVLPDFFIGAHADIERIPILTRDVRRYRTYFPDVVLIAPPT